MGVGHLSFFFGSIHRNQSDFRSPGSVGQRRYTSVWRTCVQPLRPIIITKNELQKQVYGVGYPSIPSMTVDEFYAKRYPEHARQEGAGNAVKPYVRFPSRSARVALSSGVLAACTRCTS